MPQYLGQHFLKDDSVLELIADSLNIGEEETVIEIGAGHGELTDKLLKHKSAGFILIEKDTKLAELLRAKFETEKKMRIVEGDVRKVLCDVTHYVKNPYKLCGNIPYYLTGILFRQISELENKPAVSTFTIQKDVALRITAAPPKMNRLSSSIQFWAEPKILKTVPPSAFSPPPKIYSAVIALYLKDRPESKSLQDAYYETTRALFSQPRKTIFNNLKSLLPKEKIMNVLSDMGVDPMDRPSSLSVEQIKEIAKRVGGR